MYISPSLFHFHSRAIWAARRCANETENALSRSSVCAVHVQRRWTRFENILLFVFSPSAALSAKRISVWLMEQLSRISRARLTGLWWYKSSAYLGKGKQDRSNKNQHQKSGQGTAGFLKLYHREALVVAAVLYRKSIREARVETLWRLLLSRYRLLIDFYGDKHLGEHCLLMNFVTFRMFCRKL